MARYQIVFHDDNGQRIDTFLLGDLSSMEYTILENDIGVLTLTLPLRWDFDWFQVDRIITVERDAGSGFYTEAEQGWFLRDWAFTSDENNNQLVELICYNGNYLLSGRVVAYNAGSAEAGKTNQADDMMKDFVRENLGSSATDTARRWANLTVEADRTLGPSITKAGSRQIVLTLLQEIALASWERGTYLVFDTVYTGAGQFKFKTYTGQRGEDHSSDSANPRLVTPELPRLEYLHGEEHNYIYCGGQGEEDARVIKTATNTAWTGASRWNRREHFEDARYVETEAAVQEDAYAFLYQYRPRRALSGNLQDSDGLRYGVDYRFGDIVTCQAFGVTMDCHVSSVHVTYADGQEALDILVRGEE